MLRRRLFWGLFGLLVGLALLPLLGAAYWLQAPLPLAQDRIDLSIEPGTSARGVAEACVKAGVQTAPMALYAWFRLSGQSRQIRAGSYELETGTTPLSLLRKLVRGEESLRTVTLLEGQTFGQWRAALKQAEGLRSDTEWLSDGQIMQKLGREGLHPEGRFFPDTYTYAKGSSDLALLQRAMQAMERQLVQAWQSREEPLPLGSSDEALILASIVEKETGDHEDRSRVAAVFVNRLRLGMRLQTDPSVVYGLGERFKGHLRKIDLRTDTPYNTYTRAGLPPTPIAMPGKASLWAALHPAATQDLYFVARGDGKSHFSARLDEHNRAVGRYILKTPQKNTP